LALNVRANLIPLTTVLTMSTGPPAQDQQNFVWTSRLFSFYLELYKNKFKNLNRTSKFKFSFHGLYCTKTSTGSFKKLALNVWYQENFEL